MKWLVLALTLAACASTPKKDDVPEGADPVCVKSVRHVASLHGADVEAYLETEEGKVLLDACKDPKAKEPAVQARFQCALKAETVAEVETCMPANPE